MAEKDISEKILLSFNDVFADIVNGLLFDGKQVISAGDLEEQSPRAAYKADGKIREIERDVAKRWIKNNIQIACLGLENQTEPDPDMVLRIFGYDGAEYRSQLLKENADNPRYPVVTLVLYFGYTKRWNKPVCLYDAVPVPEIIKPYLSDFKINIFEIAFLSREMLDHFHSDFKIVADYFIQMREHGNYVPSPEKLEHVQAVLQLLSIMTDDTRFEDVLNQEDLIEEGGIRNMNEWLDRIEANSMKKGMEKGEIIGSIRLYHDEMHLLPSDIVNRIMCRFSLDKDKAEEYVVEVLGIEFA